MPRHASAFQVIETVYRVTESADMLEKVKDKLDELAAENSSLQPSEAARLGLTSYNNNLRAWCNEMRRLDTRQLRRSLTMKTGHELDRLSHDLLDCLWAVGACLNAYGYTFTKKPSPQVPDLRKQGILVKMNLCLLYAVRSLRVLDSAINLIPSDMGQSIRTRMLHPPSEPMKVMWTTAKVVIKFVVDSRGKEQWRVTGRKLDDWGAGLFDEPAPLDQHLTYAGSRVLFEDICVSLGQVLAYLGEYAIERSIWLLSLNPRLRPGTSGHDTYEGVLWTRWRDSCKSSQRS